jgi:hypothetical protein
MNFNVDKSAVLHIGSSNLHQTYVLNGLPISSKDTVKDLGILIDNKLKFHTQCASAAKKAIATANYIFKSFDFLNSFLFSTLYKVFVRPHLEYSIQAWRPHYQKSHDLLEKTQRKITKWCPGLRYLPYETRLQVLKLPTLTNRFNRGDMIETFKLISHHYNISPDYFFTLSNIHRTRGHRFKLAVQKFHLDSRKFFFSNRVAPLWNGLSDHLVSSTSVTQWKVRYNELFPNF